MIIGHEDLKLRGLSVTTQTFLCFKLERYECLKMQVFPSLCTTCQIWS